MALLGLCGLAPSGCARPVPLDPEVVRLVQAVATHGLSASFALDGSVDSPPELIALIARGSAAVPTLLSLLSTTTDWSTADLIVLALGGIGDTRARQPLERLLSSPTNLLANDALDVLERLGSPESIPALRSLLARPEHGDPPRARLLGALLRIGDTSVFEELLDLGMNDTASTAAAAEALAHHGPLQDALDVQLEWGGFAGNNVLFLRAAKEWWLEQHGQSSPWKAPPDFAFREPFATEKQAAFARVERRLATGRGQVRVLPVDIEHAADAPSAPVLVISGEGHAFDIAFDIWQPRGERVALHRFTAGFKDDMVARYRTTEVPIDTMQQLLAGMRTVFAATAMPWFDPRESLSGYGNWTTSRDFGVLLTGATAPGAIEGFCGYESGTGVRQYAALTVARDLHLELVNSLACRDATPNYDARHLFAELWLQSSDRWARDSDWWFVRERLVALAGAFGDRSLVPALLEFLEPQRTEGWSSGSRTAAAACDALAAITGIDLRRDEKGARRPVLDVAAAYRERLRGK